MQPMAMIIVDDIPWIDSDGKDRWPVEEAESLADQIEHQGYCDITLVQLDG